MKKGDILLISTKYCPISWLIRKLTHSEWNHCAWILDKTRLLEAKGKGIFINHTRKYLYKRLYKVKLVRIKNVTKYQLKEAIECGLKLKGKRSYLSWVWTLILIGIGYDSRIVRYTCSGLIAGCLAKMGIFLTKNKNPPKITPGDIANSKRIKNISGLL